MTTSRRHPARRRILIITAAVVGSVAVLAAVVVGVGGAFAPSRYLEPWAADYHENFDDPRVQLVSVGLLASSGHNMQPWLVRLDSDPNVFYLYADGSRLSPAVDPLARQVMVSQGAFLQYAPLTEQQRGALADLDRDSEATLSILTQRQDLDSLGKLAIEGSTIESQSAAATVESNAVFRSNEYLKNDFRWGFSVEGQGTTGAMKYLIQGLITLIPAMNSDDAGAQRQIDLTTAAVAATPAYAIISTPANSRRHQVEAGMLYSRFDLTARSMGLVMQPLSQVIQEYPAMAAPYAAVHDQYAPGGDTIQMIVRVGTPTVEYPQTMRRDVTDLILD